MTYKRPTLLEAAEARQTRHRRPERISFSCRPVDPNALVSIAEQVEYALEAKFLVKFWSNKAQYDHALRLAHENLAYGVYGPLLNMTWELREYLMQGDEQRAIAITSGMIDVIMGKRTDEEVMASVSRMNEGEA